MDGAGRGSGDRGALGFGVVAVSAPRERRAIDYLAEYETNVVRHPNCLGVLEMIEMDEALFAGALSAEAIAANLGVSSRTIERRKALLRARGFRVPVVEREISESQRDSVRAACRARNTKRPWTPRALLGKQAEVAA